MISYNLPKNIENDDIEEVQHQSRLTILFSEVVSHSVSLLYQHSLQTLLTKAEIFQSFQSISSL